MMKFVAVNYVGLTNQAVTRVVDFLMGIIFRFSRPEVLSRLSKNNHRGQNQITELTVAYLFLKAYNNGITYRQ